MVEKNCATIRTSNQNHAHATRATRGQRANGRWQMAAEYTQAEVLRQVMSPRSAERPLGTEALLFPFPPGSSAVGAMPSTSGSLAEALETTFEERLAEFAQAQRRTYDATLAELAAAQEQGFAGQEARLLAVEKAQDEAAGLLQNILARVQSSELAANEWGASLSSAAAAAQVMGGRLEAVDLRVAGMERQMELQQASFGAWQQKLMAAEVRCEEQEKRVNQFGSSLRNEMGSAIDAVNEKVQRTLAESTDTLTRQWGQRLVSAQQSFVSFATTDKIEQRLEQLEKVEPETQMEKLVQRVQKEQAATLGEQFERKLVEMQATSASQMLEMEQRGAADRLAAASAVEQRITVQMAQIESRTTAIEQIPHVSLEKVVEMAQTLTTPLEKKLDANAQQLIRQADQDTSRVEQLVQAAVDTAVQPMRIDVDQSTDFVKQLNTEIDKFAAHIQDKVCSLEFLIDASHESSAGQVDSLIATMQDLATKQQLFDLQCQSEDTAKKSNGGHIEATEALCAQLREESNCLRADLDACRDALDAKDAANEQHAASMADVNLRLLAVQRHLEENQAADERRERELKEELEKNAAEDAAREAELRKNALEMVSQ
eukprot:COSAG05_NODE_3370_length_2107_cov_10.963645_2_plen_601_part_01